MVNDDRADSFIAICTARQKFSVPAFAGFPRSLDMHRKEWLTRSCGLTMQRCNVEYGIAGVKFLLALRVVLMDIVEIQNDWFFFFGVHLGQELCTRDNVVFVACE